MSTTNFVAGTTVIDAAWANDVDAVVWDVLGGATTVAAARTALSVTNEDIQDVVGAMATNSATITWTYNDAAATLSGAVTFPTENYDIGGFTLSAPADNDKILRHVFARSVTLPANMSGTQIYVGTNPASTATLTVLKNGVSAGAITISSAGAVTLPTQAAVNFVAGDRFELVVTTAASINDLMFTFKATET